MPAKKGHIFVVSAPSGCGKTSLIRALINSDANLVHPPSYTTRPLRPGEKKGRDYYFISKAEFNRRLNDRDFLEWSKPFGHYYATSKSAILNNIKKGKDVILSLDVNGAIFVKKYFNDSTSIYILPPSIKVLKQRLIGRMTDRSAEIQKRLSFARRDISHLNRYDYAVVNDNFGEAVKMLKSIIVSERLRVR